MKGYALFLLCVVAAAQARSTAVLTSSRAVAEAGENPWVVHLRIATSTSGFLNTCAGSLINERWILTARECVATARFIWARYGTIRVWNPELVTENSLVTLDSASDAAVININRIVHSTDNISPVAVATSADLVDSATLCAWGEENNEPGQVLNCWTIGLELNGDTYIAQSDDGQASRFDLGAPLVQDGKQIGVLTAAASSGNAGTFTSTASIAAWIQEATGLELNA